MWYLSRGFCSSLLICPGMFSLLLTQFHLIWMQNRGQRKKCQMFAIKRKIRGRKGFFTSKFKVTQIIKILITCVFSLFQDQSRKKFIWDSSTITNMVLTEISTPWDPKGYWYKISNMMERDPMLFSGLVFRVRILHQMEFC